MQDMFSYTKAAVGRAMKAQEVILAGDGEKDHVVSGGRDHRHQRSAHAALAGTLLGVRRVIETRKHPAVKLLRQVPSIGPIRAALLVALLQTPHGFRTRRQLWAYSGFAVETHDSGEYRYVRRKLRENRERMTVRGLSDNHNQHLRNLFKGAAISASTRPRPPARFR